MTSLTFTQSLIMSALVLAAVASVLYQAKRAADKELEDRVRYEDAVRLQDYINKLRASEGDELEINADNRDGEPKCIIACCGDWTGFERQRFEGLDLLHCLERATLARRLREDQHLGRSLPDGHSTQ